MVLLRYRCPYCGGRLVMFSEGDAIVVGCSECGIYVIVDAEEAINEVRTDNVGKPMEKALARKLYKKYLMYSVKAMARRENAKSINNSPKDR
ncbi:hypothetical protein [Caldivirga maquilingensis]|uniref:Uncharacterized protein n=1 Tax=Caldivirga maquilingensis (strain ATCC 700844 / DSM 13496 / JCM 10307 / IC-167) TaxID=397948 RepID=A8MDG7_CALMQ|nr:hypothetical protein [Caldivirga maquilingensis]ABW01823.1 hypothetical protein Cmaq_0992 [Caldivirga maquilingensis IC-167]